MRVLGWESRELAVVLPIEDARALCQQALRFDVEGGGRFDLRHGRTIVLWSAEEHPDGGRVGPVGVIRIRWHEADRGHATVARIAWDAALGEAGEAEVWRALAVLSGGAIGPPPAAS